MFAGITAATTWHEVRDAITPYDDNGAYSQLPVTLILSTYAATARCLGSQQADAGEGSTATAAEQGQGTEDKVGCSTQRPA